MVETREIGLYMHERYKISVHEWRNGVFSYEVFSPKRRIVHIALSTQIEAKTSAFNWIDNKTKRAVSKNTVRNWLNHEV